MPYDQDLFEDLADAWYELQQAHIDVEGSDPEAKDFREKLQELRAALAEYEQVIERIERRVGQEDQH